MHPAICAHKIPVQPWNPSPSLLMQYDSERGQGNIRRESCIVIYFPWQVGRQAVNTGSGTGRLVMSCPLFPVAGTFGYRVHGLPAGREALTPHFARICLGLGRRIFALCICELPCPKMHGRLYVYWPGRVCSRGCSSRMALLYLSR